MSRTKQIGNFKVTAREATVAQVSGILEFWSNMDKDSGDKLAAGNLTIAMAMSYKDDVLRFISSMVSIEPTTTPANVAAADTSLQSLTMSEFMEVLDLIKEANKSFLDLIALGGAEVNRTQHTS